MLKAKLGSDWLNGWEDIHNSVGEGGGGRIRRKNVILKSRLPHRGIWPKNCSQPHYLT